MSTCSDRLLFDFDNQWKQICQSDEIVLYGRTDVYSIVKLALIELGVGVPIRLFDSGRFLDNADDHPLVKRVVIACGMRSKTRESMQFD